ncbi:MAG: hypothetical protein AAF384_09630 [Pseudomonadota bacterium]
MSIGAVLFSDMTPEASWQDEFNAWYDEEHIPLRMKVQGFIGAQRYKHTEKPGYLAIYDMTSADVLKSDAYTAVKSNPSGLTTRMLAEVSGFTRYIGSLLSWQLSADADQQRLLDARYAYAVMFTVPADRAAEFNDWYCQEHVPMLLECSSWLGCRRYLIDDGEPEPFTHLAIHHLSSLDALDSPERAAARTTPWRDKLAQESWFKGTYAVYEKCGERFLAETNQ